MRRDEITAFAVYRRRGGGHPCLPALVEGLAAADQALYRAKSLGGNRLELAKVAENFLS